MIGGHGALREGFSGKDGQTDIVVRTSADEFSCHILGGLHTVGLQVLGKHRCGDVDGQHDVDALNVLLIPGVVGLRTGKHQHDQRVGDAPQDHRGIDEIHPPRAMGVLISVGVAHLECRLAFPALQKIPQYVGYEQQEQQEIFLIGKFHYPSN